MKINASEIRVGMLLEYKNDLWQGLKTQHVKPGKGGAFAQVEMKSVNKNTNLNERFRSSETVEKASLEETNFNFLYNDESNYFFMKHYFSNNKLPHGFKISIFSIDLQAINGKLTSLKFCPETKFKGSVSNHSIEQLSSSNNNHAAAISHIFGVDSMAPKV